jgi:hypothetical protein
MGGKQATSQQPNTKRTSRTARALCCLECPTHSG